MSQQTGPGEAAGAGAGETPSLVLLPQQVADEDPAVDRVVLDREVTTIGSDAGCHLRLAGLDPRHAEVRREGEADDYVIVALGRFGDTLVNGEPVDATVLRGNARVQLGGWRMIYRDERPGHLVVPSPDL